VAAVLAQMLKPLAMIVIAVTIGFGTYANLYMFYLLDWRVLVSSFSLVWLGYAFGGTCALVCRRSWPDALAVAIETGIQNTGIAIFVLRLMLDQPEADINTVVPVTVAIASSLPLCFLYALQKCVLHRYGICRPVADDLNDINDNKKEEDAKEKNPNSS
jgi:solute carrier family 10 (sodium/bile acid cotransporter), member 3/5